MSRLKEDNKQNNLIEELKPVPFIKWAGGKTQLLTELELCLPADFGTYYEPFLGSGALFFFLRRKFGYFPAWLNDINEELIYCFRAVRDETEALLSLLTEHRRKHKKKYYYRIRGLNPETLTMVQRAARIIYLNKTCYNGLYRVNKKGEFNVPMGSYKNPRIFDERSLYASAKGLERTTLVYGDFSVVLENAKANDLIYFDPPYYTEDYGFTSYAVNDSGNNAFGADEHRRLANIVNELKRRGCYVVVSNSDTEYVRKLYDDFSINVVRALRQISSNGEGRGPVNELVIKA